jgi:hypothetical protein
MRASRVLLVFCLALLIPTAALADGGQPTTRPPLTAGLFIPRAVDLLCAKERATLGQDGFASKYGTGDAGLAACRQAQLPAATTLVQGIFAACQAQGGPEVGGCIISHIKTAIGPIAGQSQGQGGGDQGKGSGGGSQGGGGSGNASTKPPKAPSAAALSALAGKVAGALCMQEAATIGKDAFGKRYGDDPMQACRAAKADSALSLVSAAVAACQAQGPREILGCATKKALSGLTGKS